jgi:hypothetical protein
MVADEKMKNEGSIPNNNDDRQIIEVTQTEMLMLLTKIIIEAVQIHVEKLKIQTDLAKKRVIVSENICETIEDHQNLTNELSEITRLFYEKHNKNLTDDDGEEDENLRTRLEHLISLNKKASKIDNYNLKQAKMVAEMNKRYYKKFEALVKDKTKKAEVIFKMGDEIIRTGKDSPASAEKLRERINELGKKITELASEIKEMEQ